MTAEEWRNIIKENCVEIGTYREEFEPIIETLAVILERRDGAEAQFKETGGNVVVGRAMTNGAMKYDMNPVLKVVNELNREALSYWRDLGLTPAGLKKLNAEVVIKPNSGFEALLNKVLTE